MGTRNLLRLAQSLVLCLVVSATAFAQYGGGSGSGTGSYTAPAGGYGTGKAIGIGVGVAAAVAGIALYVHHRHHSNQPSSSLADRTQSARNATNVRDIKNYSFFNTKALEPGGLNEPIGKGNTDGSGNSSLVESIGGAPPPMPPSEAIQLQSPAATHGTCSVQASACTPSASR
jgi:hypothetical protein